MDKNSSCISWIKSEAVWTAQIYSSCEYKTPKYYHFQFMNFKWTLKLTLVSQGEKNPPFKESKEETWNWSYWLLHKEIEKLTLHHSLTSLNANFIFQMSFHSVSSSLFFETPFQAPEGMGLCFSIRERSLENYQLLYGSLASSWATGMWSGKNIQSQLQQDDFNLTLWQSEILLFYPCDSLSPLVLFLINMVQHNGDFWAFLHFKKINCFCLPSI